ncbi:MAG: hypothetical protein PQJ50_02750 [Spirochaetales bacterium]|nr:hypothetical protein [Spirochaetales bacterium]
MFYRGLVLLTILPLLLIVSCSQENSGLLGSSSESNYSLESVEDGTVLEPGGQINIVLSELGGNAQSVKVSLLDSEGEVIAEDTVDPAILKGLGMPLDLPEDLEDGIYSLHFEVYEGTVLLYEESRYFFVSGGNLGISSLNTYPPGIKPKDTVQAEVNLLYPEESDPWLRWTLDGAVLQEGPVSEKGFVCIFTAPDKEGVYSLSAELFPVEPQGDHVSSVFRRTDIFVSSSGTISWQIIENRVYRYFIDFSDSLSNRMYASASPVITGNPVRKSQGSYKGYQFSNNDGLTFETSALPLTREGLVGDFILALVFSTSSLPAEGEYNVFTAGDGESNFIIRYIASSKVLQAGFSGSDNSFTIDLPVTAIQGEDVSYLELSYTVSGNSAAFNWISSGKTLVTSKGSPFSIPVEGSTRIGSLASTPGLPMIWYTLALSSGVPEKKAGILTSSSSVTEDRKEAELYKRSSSVPKKLDISKFNPGYGIASLEVLSDPGVKSWTLTLTGSDGTVLFSLSPAAFAAEAGGAGGQEGKILVSFINDSRGFFVNSSLDSAMSGPFPFQDSIDIKISPDTDGTISGISSIRYYQD